MGTNMPIERLYLSKESDKDVFVDNCNIYDHQVDGLRFLWKQFKKKKPGVIVNFPAHGGKSVTIVLFLNAICKLLQQPVLILCKDDAQVKKWQYCLNQWTSFSSDDIVVEPTKALLKKQIFIKSMSDLVSFTRRSWSVLVYEDDDYIGLPQFSSVDFYIWATSIDVMKDLNFLSNVHHWMCPKSNLKFEAVNGDLRKLIVLDAMLEDIVLRRNKITDKDEDKNEEYNLAKRSIKNKDVTGTKIKRSKIKTNVIHDNMDSVGEYCNNIEVNENNEERNNSEIAHKLSLTNVFEEKNINLEENSVIENIDEGIQSESCILHYDETPSDISSIVCGPSLLESNKSIVRTDNEEISLNENKEYNHDLNSELSDTTMSFEENNEILNNNCSEKLKNIVEDETHDETKEDSIDILKSDNIEVEGIVKNENVSKNLSLVKDEKDLDSKLNEMEEKAMKKFKGSFLDSIF